MLPTSLTRLGYNFYGSDGGFGNPPNGKTSAATYIAPSSGPWQLCDTDPTTSHVRANLCLARAQMPSVLERELALNGALVRGVKSWHDKLQRNKVRTLLPRELTSLGKNPE